MLHDRLTEALQRLPTSAGAVADWLVDRGVQGVRDSCNACPIARWLRRELNIPYASVDIDDVWVVDDQGNFTVVGAPLAVTLFVSNFDANEYSSLVDEQGLTDEEMWQHEYDTRFRPAAGVQRRVS